MSVKEDYVMIFPEEFKAKVKKLFPNCEEMNKRLESGDRIYLNRQVHWNLENAAIKEIPEYISTPVGQAIHKSYEKFFNLAPPQYEMIKSVGSYKELDELADEFQALCEADWEVRKRRE